MSSTWESLSLDWYDPKKPHGSPPKSPSKVSSDRGGYPSIPRADKPKPPPPPPGSPGKQQQQSTQPAASSKSPTSKKSILEQDEPPVDDGDSGWDVDVSLDSPTQTKGPQGGGKASEASAASADGGGKASEAASPDNTSASTTKGSKAPAGRQLAPLEAARSVEEALTHKQMLAEKTVESSLMTIAERRRAIEEKQKKELLELQRQEESLKRLKEEVVAPSVTRSPEVERLRITIERLGRDIEAATRDADAKRERMKKATNDFNLAEKHLKGLKSDKQKAEEKMLDTMLELGKQRDAKLNSVLENV